MAREVLSLSSLPKLSVGFGYSVGDDLLTASLGVHDTHLPTDKLMATCIDDSGQLYRKRIVLVKVTHSVEIALCDTVCAYQKRPTGDGVPCLLCMHHSCITLCRARAGGCLTLAR